MTVAFCCGNVNSLLGLWQTHEKLARETYAIIIATCSENFLMQMSHIDELVFYVMQETHFASFLCEFLVQVCDSFPCVCYRLNRVDISH